MKIEFAERMKDYEEGIFQLLNEKKLAREAKGGKVYNFSVGTPDFEPPKHIVDALVEAAKKPANFKYSLRDIPELSEAVISRYEKRYGVKLTADEIMSVYGSQEGISHIAFTIVNPGDIVLVPDPGYPVFSIGPSLAGANITPYKLYKEKGYLPDLNEIERLYGKTSGNKAKAIMVSYPLNPVCKCAPDSFYEELIAFAKKNDIFIIHDNAYSDIVYDGKTGKSILSFEGAKDVCVEFYSLSKSFNYTGARMSFVVGNKDFIAGFKRFRSQIDYGIFLPVQYGAIAALTGPDECVKEQCMEYEKRRNALCDGLTGIGWKFERSQGTMFAWTAIPDKYGNDDVAFVMDLFEKTGVLCTPGSSFGELGKGHVRFALVLPVSVIEEAVGVIKESGILN
ncbi:MAG: aminotransferase class I/II-fold pyridoxal phosphate-dependent enzyme [Lachnospiraceae bacterium]|nr:aminotransferase class I/II-fold pyridoxal phosphate-dependent enzyme [Lachnospiraceae bacterium]